MIKVRGHTLRHPQVAGDEAALIRSLRREVMTGVSGRATPRMKWETGLPQFQLLGATKLHTASSLALSKQVGHLYMK